MNIERESDAIVPAAVEEAIEYRAYTEINEDGEAFILENLSSQQM